MGRLLDMWRRFVYMVISNDAVITHELTVKFREDGSFQYLGNKVLEDGIHQIPQYQYRIAR